MRTTLLTGFILLLPATAFAQAPDAGKAPAPAKPAEAKAPAKPAETKPAAKPTEAKPAEAAKPAETKPAETKPAEAKPAEAAKPAETKPAETKPAETKPAETKPAEGSAAGPAGPGASTDAAATGTLSTSAKAQGADLGTGQLIDPGATDTGQAERPLEAPPPVVSRRSAMSYEEAEAQWKFSYHGYLRAPMRIGLGKRLPEDTNGYTISGQTDMTIHEASIPDDQYLSFQSTSHNMRSWAEGFFGFGNGMATGIIGIGSYNLTEGGFNDFRANWGITQAYVLLTPDLGYDNVRIWAKAGAIVDRYGMSGRYDAGEYDTYMFGRTHVVGETFHLDYDINNLWTLSLEQGLGSHKPDPNSYNNARFTMLHHEHIGLKQGRDLEFGAHYLVSWAQEEYRPTSSPGDPFPTREQSALDLAPRNGLPNGKLWVAGVEARAELGAFGYIYGSYSHIGADYALTVSRAIEVLHSSGGGEFDLGIPANYLDSPRCHDVPPESLTTIPGAPPENWTALDPDACSDGNGYVNALHGQYEFSLTNFNQQISGGPRFWGAGFDAILKLYALVAIAHSDARDTTQLPKENLGNFNRTTANFPDIPNKYTVTKAKFGADLTIQALPWLSPALRFDRVMPNNHIPEQNFAVLSPRVMFKTAWVTHERITLGYSHYFYNERTCEPRSWDTSNNSGTVADTTNDPLAAFRCVQAPPSAVPYDGFGTSTAKQEAGTRATGVQRPDENVFKIEATMWW
jgi:hypothetical protein